MKFWATHELVAELVRLGRQFTPLEVGGILLGWRDKSDWIATGMIGPGPRAMHGRHAFVPDHEWQVAELRKAFSASSGDLNYLGDWHTHPTGPARMSNDDHRTLRRIGRKVVSPAMMIVDPSSEPPEVAAWSAERQGLFRISVQTLEVREFQRPSGWPSAFVG